jgi:hypothetical protein
VAYLVTYLVAYLVAHLVTALRLSAGALHRTFGTAQIPPRAAPPGWMILSDCRPTLRCIPIQKWGVDAWGSTKFTLGKQGAPEEAGLHPGEAKAPPGEAIALAVLRSSGLLVLQPIKMLQSPSGISGRF